MMALSLIFTTRTDLFASQDQQGAHDNASNPRSAYVNMPADLLTSGQGKAFSFATKLPFRLRQI